MKTGKSQSILTISAVAFVAALLIDLYLIFAAPSNIELIIAVSLIVIVDTYFLVDGILEKVDEIVAINIDKQNELTKVEKGIYSVAKREEISRNQSMSAMLNAMVDIREQNAKSCVDSAEQDKMLTKLCIKKDMDNANKIINSNERIAVLIAKMAAANAKSSDEAIEILNDIYRGLEQGGHKEDAISRAGADGLGVVNNTDTVNTDLFNDLDEIDNLDIFGKLDLSDNSAAADDLYMTDNFASVENEGIVDNIDAVDNLVAEDDLAATDDLAVLDYLGLIDSSGMVDNLDEYEDNSIGKTDKYRDYGIDEADDYEYSGIDDEAGDYENDGIGEADDYEYNGIDDEADDYENDGIGEADDYEYNGIDDEAGEYEDDGTEDEIDDYEDDIDEMDEYEDDKVYEMPEMVNTLDDDMEYTRLKVMNL